MRLNYSHLTLQTLSTRNKLFTVPCFSCFLVSPVSFHVHFPAGENKMANKSKWRMFCWGWKSEGSFVDIDFYELLVGLDLLTQITIRVASLLNRTELYNLNHELRDCKSLLGSMFRGPSPQAISVAFLEFEIACLLNGIIQLLKLRKNNSFISNYSCSFPRRKGASYQWGI